MTNTTHLNYDDMLPVPVETRQQWYDDGIESVSLTYLTTLGDLIDSTMEDVNDAMGNVTGVSLVDLGYRINRTATVDLWTANPEPDSGDALLVTVTGTLDWDADYDIDSN